MTPILQMNKRWLRGITSSRIIQLISGGHTWNTNATFSTSKYPITSVICFRLSIQNAEVSIDI